MADKPKLTGYDYFNLPLSVLIKHPDYNGHVYRIVQAISNMTTQQLETLDITVRSK